MILNHAQEWGLKVINDTPAEHIIGVDEVGLGACAGPLVVCGAVFPKGWSHPEVKDSKAFTGGGKIAHEKRLKVMPFIREACLYQSVIVTSHTDIDALGMAFALEDAMRHAARSCALAYPDSIVVLDGDNFPRLSRARAVVALPKGDVLVPAVSAASIIAKTTRDALMITLDSIYPGYDLDQHMGYYTEGHRDALVKRGVSAIHRRSYKCIQELLQMPPTG